MIQLFNGNCLDIMKDIPDKSIDMVLADLPYGTTQNKWDNVIPFEPLWEQYNRVIKDNGAIVLFGSEPFSSKLRMSNIKHYKYDWVWEKSRFGNPMLAKIQPLKITENISVFSKKKCRYFPQGLIYCNKVMKQGNKITENLGGKIKEKVYLQEYTNYPRNILRYKSVGKTVHSTQKPVDLLEYLIKTYTNEGETVLDNCMGSGSTGVACVNTKRNFIGIELYENYFNIAKERIDLIKGVEH